MQTAVHPYVLVILGDLERNPDDFMGAWGAQYQRTQPLATRLGATGSNQRRRVAAGHLRRGSPHVEEIFAMDDVDAMLAG